MKLNSKIWALLLILTVATQLAASAQTKLQQADRHFRNFEYHDAIVLYENLLKYKKPNLHIAQRLADSYRMTNNYKQEEAWYAKVLTYSYADPINNYYYAEALRNNNKFKEAKEQFILYGKKAPQYKDKAEKLAAICDQAAEWIANPTMVEVKNETQLNSSKSDFSPVFVKKGLVFSSDREIGTDADKHISPWTGNPYIKLFSSERDSIKFWTTPILVKDEDLEHDFDNGPATLSKDREIIYFTRSNKIKNPKKVVGKDKANGFINRLEIYTAKRQGMNWDGLTPFQYNNFKEYSVGHPALSPDGKILYFVSDMQGGFGETDIYFCEKKADGTWSKPVNAGNKINTSGKEVFPSVSYDGTLYFSSNGLLGMGGLDLFSAKGSMDNWTEIVNLKYPMNSAQDDFGMVVDSTGKMGYFSSNREGGIGMDDIYSYKQPSCILAGITLEQIHGQDVPLEDVSIKLYKKGDTTTVVAYETSGGKSKATFCRRSYEPCKIVTDAKGRFFFELQQGETYEIKGTKQGYFTSSAVVTADCQASMDTIKIAMLFNKIVLNKPIVISDIFFNDDKLFVKKNIYYDLDKAYIRPDAAIELDKLVELLKDNPDIKIELGAHTDSRESDEYNQKLSQRRAQSAVNYIVSKGIPKETITAKGYGESRLVNKCKDGVQCTEEEHQMNRRTEIKVTEIMSRSNP